MLVREEITTGGIFVEKRTILLSLAGCLRMGEKSDKLIWIQKMICEKKKKETLLKEFCILSELKWIKFN